jgi:hypothetical protein
MQLFMAVPMTPSAALADFGGRRNRRFIPFVDTAEKFIAGVVATAEQVIAGVVDTADKHSFAIISANFQKKSK